MRIFLLIMALIWSGCAYAEDRSPDINLSSITSSFNVQRPVYSQGDPAWASLKLGTTTVKKSGCLAFALMDVLTGMGIQSDPPETFIETLSENGLFTRSGLLVWNLERVFPVETTRLKLTGSSAFEEARYQLALGNGVVLQVVTDRGTYHWVAAAQAVAGDIVIRDSNGGTTKYLSSSYGIDALRGLATVERI